MVSHQCPPGSIYLSVLHTGGEIKHQSAMTTTIEAIQKVRPESNGLEIRETTVPGLKPDEVLIKVRAAAICGSDLHLYQWDDSIRGKLLRASNNFERGLTIGHEFCGHIVELGSAVNTPASVQYGQIKVGDFVSAESHAVCQTCYQCRRDEKHVCVNDKIIGFDRDGCFSEYIALPASCVWVNDKDLPWELAAVQEPLGNAMHAAGHFPLQGESVAVFGCGPIGMFAIAIAKAHGARKIIAVDINPMRLGIAEKLGAVPVLQEINRDWDTAKNRAEQLRVAAAVKQLGENDGPDVILEMSGNVGAINNAMSAVRRGGKVVLFGIPKDDSVTLERLSSDIIFKGVTVQGIIGRRIYHTWEQVRDLLSTEANRALIRQVVSDVMPWRSYQDAFSKMLAGKAAKIVLDFAPAK